MILKKKKMNSLLKNSLILASLLISFSSNSTELLDDKLKEALISTYNFSPKLKVWSPTKFTQACVSDIDRDLKLKSERNTLRATNQIDNHTNGGYMETKQLY